jgi:methionyl-tRNA formyltransferase
MEMVKAMDAGVMYHKEEIEISDDDNYTSLYQKMTECAKLTALNSLDKYLNGELVGIPQNEDEVTFANKILKEDEQLILSRNCRDFVNAVRGLSYNPGGYFYLENIKFKVLKCHKTNDKIEAEIGTIVFAKKHNIIFQLSDGQICIDELQIPGKKVMKTCDFLNGYHDELVGKKFSNEL